MKPVVIIASLVLLLYAITIVGSQRNRFFGRLSNQLEPPPKNEKCEDYNDISKWMNEQLKLNVQMEKSQTDLGLLLSALNRKKSPKECIFDEETTMQLIFDNVNEIDKESRAQLQLFKPSGDLEKDLKIILKKFKKEVKKDFISCCESLTDTIQKIKDELEKSVQNFLKELKKIASENSRKNDDLHKKLTEVESQIEDIKLRLETMQKQLANDNTKCCTELKGHTLDLENKLKNTKTEEESQAEELDNQLKELKDKQRNQNSLTNNLKKTIEDRSENIKANIEMCNKNCKNEDSSQDKQLLEKQVEDLHKLVEDLSKKLRELESLGESKQLNTSLHNCQENAGNLLVIQIQIDELVSQKNENCGEESPDVFENCSSSKELDRKIELVTLESERISAELKKFPNCCQRIDELSQKADNLKALVIKMNQSFRELIEDSEGKFKDLKGGMKEKFKKLSDIDKINNNEAQQFENLEKRFNKANRNVETLKEKQDEFFKLIEKTKHSKNLPDEMAKLKSDYDDFRQKVIEKLKRFKEKRPKEASHDYKDREDKLEKLNEIVRQDMDKLKQALMRYDKLEQEIKDKIENQITPSNRMVQCKTKCKETSKIDRLIEEIDGAEELVKMRRAKSTPKPTSKPKPTLKPKPNPRPKPKKKTTKSDVILGPPDYFTTTRTKKKPVKVIKPKKKSTKSDVILGPPDYYTTARSKPKKKSNSEVRIGGVDYYTNRPYKIL